MTSSLPTKRKAEIYAEEFDKKGYVLGSRVAKGRAAFMHHKSNDHYMVIYGNIQLHGVEETRKKFPMHKPGNGRKTYFPPINLPRPQGRETGLKNFRPRLVYRLCFLWRRGFNIFPTSCHWKHGTKELLNHDIFKGINLNCITEKRVMHSRFVPIGPDHHYLKNKTFNWTMFANSHRDQLTVKSFELRNIRKSYQFFALARFEDLWRAWSLLKWWRTRNNRKQLSKKKIIYSKKMNNLFSSKVSIEYEQNLRFDYWFNHAF